MKGIDNIQYTNRASLIISFEFFPPKTEKMMESLWHSLVRLAPLGPRFVSVTYGAGGGTRVRTHSIVSRIRAETELEPAAHLTCVGATIAEVDAIARGYYEAGVKHVVALRGIRLKEKSVSCPIPEAMKVRSVGIEAPVVPGILPVTNFQQVVRFSSMCGASIPGWFANRFDGLDNDPSTRHLVAAHTAADQCFGLLDSGIDEFHFYTLNRADLVFAICHMLGMRTAAHAGIDEGRS